MQADAPARGPGWPRLLRTATVVATFLIAACGDPAGKTPPAPPDQDGVFQPYLEAVDQAGQVEDLLQQGAARQRQALEAQE